MKLIIDIPDGTTLAAIGNSMIGADKPVLAEALKNAVMLHKGHGRLIDIDAMIGNLKYQSSQVWRLDAVKPEDYYIVKDAKYMETVWKNWCESFYKYAETRPVIVAADKEGKG